jgi:putative flippase GtrA
MPKRFPLRDQDEAARYIFVGVTLVCIDFAIFNAIIVLESAAGHNANPLLAKTISQLLSIILAYFGHKYFTFPHRQNNLTFRQSFFPFIVVTGIGSLIALMSLWLSHYALGHASIMADNISANVVGQILGTSFRFFAHKRWVFPNTEILTDVTH